MRVGLEDISYVLPSRIIDSKTIADEYGFELDFVVNKLGIRERRYLSDSETVSGLASLAVMTLLNRTKISPADVEALVVVTQTPDYQLPQVSTLVQSATGINSKALVLDISLGCSGYVVGLSTLKSLMESLEMNKGILVTVDAYSRILDAADRGTAPLFGDAATASMLGTSPAYLIGRPLFGSDGSQSEALIVHGSGSTVEPRAPLRMDGRGIFNFAMSVVPESMSQCLSINGLTHADVAKVVLHQANKFMIESIAKRSELDETKFIIDLEDVGNTTSSSIPIALKRCILPLYPESGIVLIAGFGVGLHWASNVLIAER